jgi:phosphoglycolate phosphatase
VSGAARGRALLLDLDGTLLDTARDMGAALNALRLEHGRAELPFESIRPQVSHGGAALVRLGFGEADADEHERLRRRFLDLYAQALVVHTALFEGYEDVLSRLERARIPVGVVTNKPGWLAAPILATLGLDRRLACVVAGDTLPQRKPHPAPLLHAAALAGLDATTCVYVGDAERDIIAGRAAGMQTVAVRFGYLAPGEDPAARNPDGIAERPADLLGWIAGLGH